MAAEDVNGVTIKQIAAGAWNSRKNRYQGFNYTVAVGNAKAGIERVRGGRKERIAEAKHQVQVLFDKSREETPERLDAVAREAQDGVSAGQGFSASEDSELYKFASEVSELLNGPLTGGFGVVDPQMIINLILAIIQAIQTCKNLRPVQVPA